MVEEPLDLSVDLDRLCLFLYYICAIDLHALLSCTMHCTSTRHGRRASTSICGPRSLVLVFVLSAVVLVLVICAVDLHALLSLLLCAEG